MAQVTWQQLAQHVAQQWDLEFPKTAATVTMLFPKENGHCQDFRQLLAAQSSTIQELVRARSFMGYNSSYAVTWQLLDEMLDQILNSVRAFAHIPYGLPYE
ncbi:hypothetical protein HB364_13640 [Pseudoflavitalea sp. X16]|uniref:hypothetical protein n=1 Tax=Paraflavitalea devenefica TaxID=2716334 RepID=UPI001423F1C6|nr:hypothetical protein [Paraflavitalea devenefica]NII26131.1 hypothetical protein [Paraflavitalea devenefica]